MSTRATYEFCDEYDNFTIFKMHDGYPSSALEFINNSLSYAWTLPRFEACEFAAAFVAANKIGPGGVYYSKGKNSHADTQFHYTISLRDNNVWVKIENMYSGNIPDIIDEDFLYLLLDRYADNK